LKTSFYYKQKSILIKIIKEMTKMADNPVISKVKVNGTTYDIKSSEASHSTTADSATTATNAGHATNADSATNATNATNANHATTADSATSATTATTLKDTRVIDGINFNGSGDVRHYASCATASGTGTKTVTCSNFTLAIGSTITVKFNYTNTAIAGNLKLDVQNTGAKAIKYRNANLSSPGILAANRIYTFVYDGSYWQIVGDLSDVSDSDTNGNILIDGTETNVYTHPTYSSYTGNPTADQTPGFGSSFNVSQVTTDSTGHVSSMTSRKITIPSKIFDGATSSSAGTIGLVPSPVASDRTKYLCGNGKWESLPSATTSASGIVQLSSAVDSNAGYYAATSSAVKQAYDLANGKSTVSFTRSLTSGTKIGSISIDGTSTDIYCEKDTDTWTAMTGATSSANGTVGYVNAIPPKDGYNTKFLRADGTWAIPTGSDTKVSQTNTTTDTSYRVLLSHSANDTTETDTVNKSSSLTYNPSNGMLTVGDGIYSINYTDNQPVAVIHRGVNIWINAILDLTAGTFATPTGFVNILAGFDPNNTTKPNESIFIGVADESDNISWYYALHKGNTYHLLESSDDNWSSVGVPLTPGYIFKVLRVGKGSSAPTPPAWAGSKYDNGIVVGHEDGKMLITAGMTDPHVTFAGGHNSSTVTKPEWYFKLKGTSGTTYNLDTHHPTIEMESDTGGMSNLDHNDTFIVRNVTRDDNGHVISIDTKTYTLVANKVTQTNSTSNSAYRLLLSYGANDTTVVNTTYKNSQLTFNPSTAVLTAGNTVRLHAEDSAATVTSADVNISADIINDGYPIIDITYGTTHAGVKASSFYGKLEGTISSDTTATTQSVSDSSTKVATTKFVKDVIDDLSPESTETTSSSTIALPSVTVNTIQNTTFTAISGITRNSDNRITGDTKNTFTFGPLKRFIYQRTTQNNTWDASGLGTSTDNALLILRTGWGSTSGQKNPSWAPSSNHGVGIGVANGDKRGYIGFNAGNASVPEVSFAAGTSSSTSTTPGWYFKIKGSSGETYDLSKSVSTGDLISTSQSGNSFTTKSLGADVLGLGLTRLKFWIKVTDASNTSLGYSSSFVIETGVPTGTGDNNAVITQVNVTYGTPYNSTTIIKYATLRMAISIPTTGTTTIKVGIVKTKGVSVSLSNSTPTFTTVDAPAIEFTKVRGYYD
jgi:hypothetical protein